MKRVACALIFVFAVHGVFAGDIAEFVNLGFSNDGRFFMFGQYGIQETGQKPYADLYLVDVRRNAFVENGRKSAVYDQDITPGQDGHGALFTLYRDSVQLARTYTINHMNGGRLLYLLVDGEKPKETLRFRDFDTGSSFDISLLQDSFGSGDSVSASFHINMTVQSAGAESRHYTVGLPSYRRPGVLRYRIQRIFYGPEEESVVFVVEKELQAESGVDVRYMVETLYLD